jgi:hypothetical protein
MNSFTGNTNSANSTNPLTGGNTVGGPQQNKDYGDKAFDAISKKTGHGNLNPSTSEKITDGARGLFEKATGLVSPHHCLHSVVAVC